MERARLILEDRKKGKLSAHKSWWDCAEQEFIKPDPTMKVRIKEFERECFDWYSTSNNEETYFCYTNTNRRVMQKGE